jgi:hypothetical protein
MTRAIMTFEIGNLTLSATAPARFLTGVAAVERPLAGAERPVAAVTTGVVDRSDVIPASPPLEALAEVDAAWERAQQLAGENRELHFACDKETGRVIIEVRTLDGQVLRTIPPSKALSVAGGEAL